MPHVVGDACVRCRYTDCAEVCPVTCFHAAPNMLVIDPEVCIDCGLCLPECPVDAIYVDDDLPEDQIEYIQINAKLSQQYDIIEYAEDPHPEADKYKDVKNKKDLI
tara:strand:+ start:322 stop:639 length:318 start_codon:yes stop_codon:yes gene_type:complete